MKRVSVVRNMLLLVCFSVFANLAHPVTPTFLQNLHVHDYMFGVAFACMSLTTFLFSPLWGKISDRIGRVRIIALGFILYGFAQFWFGKASSELTIIPARFLAGAGASACTVGQLAYIVDNSNEVEKKKILVYAGTITAVCSAFGYLIGGVLGDWVGVNEVFVIQTICLVGTGILDSVLLKDDATKFSQEKIQWGSLIKEANPLKVVVDARKYVNTFLLFFFFSVLFASFASTCYDQSFNYFLKDQLQFPTSYNGYVKAAIGMIGLVVNSTICMWIIQKTKIEKSYSWVMVGCTCSSALALFVNRMDVFILVNLLFYAFNSIYQPLQQGLLSHHARDNGGVLFGLFNSVRALGMVGGSLFAGFIYSFGAKLPFLFATISFLCAAFVSMLSRRHAE